MRPAPAAGRVSRRQMAVLATANPAKYLVTPSNSGRISPGQQSFEGVLLQTAQLGEPCDYCSYRADVLELKTLRQFLSPRWVLCCDALILSRKIAGPAIICRDSPLCVNNNQGGGFGKLKCSM